MVVEVVVVVVVVVEAAGLVAEAEVPGQVSEAEAEEHARILVEAEVVRPGPISVAVARRGPISIQVVRADPPHRHGPVFLGHRLPQRGPVCQQPLARAAVVGSGTPISARRFPAAGQTASVAEILGWASGLA